MTTPITVLERPLDETSELTPSFKHFKLPAFLRDGLKRLNFQTPTKIQADAIPFLLDGQDLIAQSQTGSGKTAAFAIPLLARIDRQSSDLQVLVMVPTRELAIQVTQVFKALAGTAVRVTPIYGGAGMEGQSRGLMRGGYQVVVGTPGRLRDHLGRGTLKLHKLRAVVLDEADEMLDQGFAQDVEAIISTAPPVGQRQTALFSATLPEWVGQTAKKHLRPDHASIVIEGSKATTPDIAHLVYDMKAVDKSVALRHLLDTHAEQPILVFARTKHGVKKIAAKLEDEGYSVAGLQGNLSQNAREQVMSAFRTNRIRIMVATNVGARGLDVSGISHVINYDLPESAELFTHRIGRTGRNGASGTAITFLTGEDRIKWREIERTMRERGTPLTRQAWDGPRAEPGAISQEPTFRDFTPRSRSFDGPRRDFDRPAPARRPFDPSGPARRDFDRPAPARRPFDDARPTPARRPFDDAQPARRPDFAASGPTNGNREDSFESRTERARPAGGRNGRPDGNRRSGGGGFGDSRGKRRFDDNRAARPRYED